MGATIKIMAHRFVVFNADEYSLRYMEANEHRWAWSDLKKIAKKVRSKQEVLSRFILTTPNVQTAYVTYDELFDLLERSGVGAVRQEAMTLGRYLDPSRTGKVKLSKVLKYLMDNEGN